MKLIAFLILTLSSSAFADSDDRSRFEEVEKQVQQYADLANKACESSITFELDRPSFAGAFNSNGKSGLDVFRLDAITEPFRQIRFICLDGKPQAAGMRKSITSVRLGFAAQPTQSLKKGSLVVHVPKAGNKRSWAADLKAFIKKQI